MKITMDGKYAYRGNPTEQVRILCVDRSPFKPVVSLAKSGNIYSHTESGSFSTSGKEHGWDLIPLKKKPVERWGVERKDGTLYCICATESGAEEISRDFGGRIFLMREVVE